MVSLLVIGCQEKTPTEIRWVHTKTIALDGINPIGIAQAENGIWLSDGDHNRIVQIDENGNLLNSLDSLNRPMHIAAKSKVIFIPQYGNDEILRYSIGGDIFEPHTSILKTKDSLDAPAGIAVYRTEIAIADFYNNKIHYTPFAGKWLTFGKEGNADGDFYYPTDVQITEDKIWVADAYNNRLQVFDKQGNHLNTIGVEQKMNAATGIFVTDQEVFSTDFENDRVLVFSLDGAYRQELKESISKPTDMMVIDGLLYVTNYKGKSLSIFEQKEVAVVEEGGEGHHDHHDEEGEHKDHDEEGEHTDEHEGHEE